MAKGFEQIMTLLSTSEIYAKIHKALDCLIKSLPPGEIVVSREHNRSESRVLFKFYGQDNEKLSFQFRIPDEIIELPLPYPVNYLAKILDYAYLYNAFDLNDSMILVVPSQEEVLPKEWIGLIKILK